MTSPGGSGYHVDPDALLQARNGLQEIQERAAALLALAADANPEWTIWGAAGAPFAVWYWATADEVYNNLQLMGETLADNVRALGDSAQVYAEADSAIANALAAIEQELSDKGAPW